MYKVLLTSTTMRVGNRVNAAGAYSELGLPSGHAGYVTWTPEKTPPPHSWHRGGHLHTSHSSDGSGTDQRAIDRNHYFMHGRNWMTGKRNKRPVASHFWRNLSEWLSASKKIVKIQIHAGPICQTRCCCIPMKGNVIMEPGFLREWAGGLDN